MAVADFGELVQKTNEIESNRDLAEVLRGDQRFDVFECELLATVDRETLQVYEVRLEKNLDFTTRCQVYCVRRFVDLYCILIDYVSKGIERHVYRFHVKAVQALPQFFPARFAYMFFYKWKKITIAISNMRRWIGITELLKGQRPRVQQDGLLGESRNRRVVDEFFELDNVVQVEEGLVLLLQQHV